MALDKNQLTSAIENAFGANDPDLSQQQQQAIQQTAQDLADAIHNYTKQAEVEVDHSNSGTKTYPVQ